MCREVTGYVLVSHVDVRRIVLPSLQIIRGRDLFKLTVQVQKKSVACLAAPREIILSDTAIVSQMIQSFWGLKLKSGRTNVSH